MSAADDDGLLVECGEDVGDEFLAHAWGVFGGDGGPGFVGPFGVGMRLFDAVVVGEYERAFYRGQFRTVMMFLADQGVELWLPEADGPVDLGDPAHQASWSVPSATRSTAPSRHVWSGVDLQQPARSGTFQERA